MTFVVNSNSDAPDIMLDGICDDGSGFCTLRAAIQEANANPGHDIIQFNIPGSGVHTITTTMPMDQLFDNAGVTIDGLSQPGANKGNNPPRTTTLMIELTPAAPMPAYPGLHILSDSNLIQGLIINNFGRDGIRIEATGDTTAHNRIYANFIGTDAGGTVGVGNGVAQLGLDGGVSIVTQAPACPAGHVSAYNLVDHNLISSNYAQGVNISRCPPGDVFGNTVEFNFIGTDVTGTAPLGNVHDGVYIGEGAHDNLVDHNTICDNGYEGVAIVGLLTDIPNLAHSNIVSNNKIGLDHNNNPLMNHGNGVSIGIYGSSQPVPTRQLLGLAPNNSIDNNTIAYNGGNGIAIYELSSYNNTNADGNLIFQNAIHDNALLGIDLDDDGVTANDLGNSGQPVDVDQGANQDLNFPTITQARITAANTTIEGYVDVLNPTMVTVEIFLSDKDNSGYGQGLISLGTTTPDMQGQWSMTTTKTVTPNDALTATTMDLNNNTSEFGPNFAGVVVGVENVGEAPDLSIELYPNPAEGSTRIILMQNAERKGELQIISPSGEVLNTLPAHHPSMMREIDLRDFAPGMYFVRYSDGEVIRTVNLVVTRR